jgi:SAM-dependent methyltransferase
VPDAFRDTFVAMAAARAVIAATRLGVLEALQEQPARAGELAERLGLDAAGVQALLATLASLGYVEQDSSGVYRPASAGAQLVLGTSDSIAHFVGEYSAQAWSMLGGLEEVLRDPSSAASHGRPPEDSFWEAYIRGLFELNRRLFDEFAAFVPARDPRLLLDVAGGHGGFAMAMCRRFPSLQATVLDLPASARVGRRIVEDEGFAQRVAFREGDALRESLGEEQDVLSMFNLLHHLRPEAVAELLARAHAALRPGGHLVIGETEPGTPGQTPEVIGAASALVYFVSSGTRNYTRLEIAGWLERAGFEAIEVRRSQAAPWRLIYLARATGPRAG